MDKQNLKKGVSSTGGQKLSANYALTFIMGSRIEKSLMGCPKEVDQLLWKRTTRITPKIQAMKLKK